MWSLQKPTTEVVDSFLAQVADSPFSYEEVGISQGGGNAEDNRHWPGDFDHQRGLLGEGEEAYLAACGAVASWQMFPDRWTAIYRGNVVPQNGNVVALAIRTFGLWSLSACRVVEAFDESGPTRCFGFAYGTLPTHVESGEERFAVEMDQQGRVWYDLRAWSRPKHILTRVGYPVARIMQARFRRDSLAALRRAVADAVSQDLDDATPCDRRGEVLA